METMFRRWHLRSIACWLAIWLPNSSTHADSTTYLQQIKPLLKQRCFACHGALKQEAGLRLDTSAFILRGGDSGSAVEPHRPEASLMVDRISADDPDYRMPPDGKPLSVSQIETLRNWIGQGARAPHDDLPEQDPRNHWAFRSPQRPLLPAGTRPVANVIDAFTQRPLEQLGWPMAAPAARTVLARRVYLDLIGLPPTPKQLEQFLSDPLPGAYERLVDRLLGSPLYGQRWARHWMDVWRYSDWYGRRMVPDVWNSAPQIWRWRDWIVQSLNDDLGYDQMVSQMIAGDEIEPLNDTAGYATGFLIRNWYALNPNDWMRNTVEHTGKAFLGLTFNCAHCHDHKYDPISQVDYFRLRAFFEPIAIRQDQVPGEPNPGAFQEYEYSTLRKIVRHGAVRIYDKAADAPTWFYADGDERNRQEKRGSIAPDVPAFLGPMPHEIQSVRLPTAAHYPGYRPEIRDTLREIARQATIKAEQQLAELSVADTRPGDGEPAATTRAVRVAQRDAAVAEERSVQSRLAADTARMEQTADAAKLALLATRHERIAERMAAQAKLVADQRAHELARSDALADATEENKKRVAATEKQLAKTKETLSTAQARHDDVTRPTNYTAASPQYPRTSTGRRRALARWLTSRDNPLPARVAVNHIWLRHFHAPLVDSVFDFGRNGAEPTHPELLDWLAVELMESNWSMKHLHRLIVTSQLYRSQSGVGAAQQICHAADPDNRRLWRMNVGRMESEIVRDSLLHCAEQLDLQLNGQELENTEALTTQRRSLYYSCHPENGGKSEFGQLFDAADATDCYRRTRTVIPQQALALTNSQLVHTVSRHIATQLSAAIPDSDRSADVKYVSAVFTTLLSRKPTPAEQQVCLNFLRRASTDEASTDEASTDEADDDFPLRLRIGLVRAVLNHNDFVAIR